MPNSKESMIATNEHLLKALLRPEDYEAEKQYRQERSRFMREIFESSPKESLIDVLARVGR